MKHEVEIMAEKKGKFEFDDKMKEGAKKAGQDIKKGGGDLVDGAKKVGNDIKEAGGDLKDDITDMGSKIKKKFKK